MISAFSVLAFSEITTIEDDEADLEITIKRFWKTFVHESKIATDVLEGKKNSGCVSGWNFKVKLIRSVLQISEES